MTRMTSLLSAVCAGMVLTVSGVANAALLVEESFVYAGGSNIETQNGGIGWGGAWTDGSPNNTVGGATLTYSGLVTSGGYLISPSQNAGAFRAPAAGFVTGGSTDLWGSFLLRQEGATSAAYNGLSLFDGGTETLFVGKPYNGTNYGIDQVTGGLQTSTVAVDNTTRFFVFQLTDNGANTRVNVWIDSVVGSPLGTPTLTATRGDFNLTNLRIQGGDGNGGSYGYDEIRFGTTLADVAPAVAVVPEAGTASLLGLLGVPVLGAIALRRRK